MKEHIVGRDCASHFASRAFVVGGGKIITRKSNLGRWSATFSSRTLHVASNDHESEEDALADLAITRRLPREARRAVEVMVQILATKS